MGTLVSIDGHIVPPENATISIFDRGFLYGDSVYEVMRTYDGVPFELDHHLRRLEGSAARISMVVPFARSLLAEETLRAQQASGNADSYLRVVVTRGAGPIGLDIALAETPCRIIIVKSLEGMRPPASAYEEGVQIALVGVRRNLRAAIDPKAKTGNYLNSVMALAEARAAGAYEAVMLDHRDFVTEGASSNVFVVVGDVILTPPADAGILIGVTRAVVLEVARSAGLRVLELPLTQETLCRDADEVFITSSVREIVPVTAVDARIVGDGRPGPITRRVMSLFSEYVAAYVKAHRVS